MTDVAELELDELPIGTGQRRVTKASAGDGLDDVGRSDQQRRAGPEQPSPALAVVTPEPEPAQLSLWEPAKMRRPLQIVVGKTVNWRMRKATGVDTTAGLMSNDQADAINEPLAEIMNRFEPLRAIAAHQEEVALGVAIWDYVQATVVQAGRDVQAIEDAYTARAAAATGGTYDEEHPPPPPLPFEPPAAAPTNDNAEEDEL